MTAPKRILCVIGTRPEAIKIAPVWMELKRRAGFDVRLLSTGQHTTMLDDVVRCFSMQVDYDLQVMRPGQSLAALTQAVLVEMAGLLDANPFDWLVVQGDTATAFAAALAGFYRRVKVGHVEAGLRTYNLEHPWPEESHRRMIAALASRHWAPTEAARRALAAEGIAETDIRLTGNTIVDALQHARGLLQSDDARMQAANAALAGVDLTKRVVLVTAHRRENFGARLEAICSALAMLGERDDVEIVFPVHLNPSVGDVVRSRLSGCRRIHLLPPLDYLQFINLLGRSTIALTDSGGIQEEGPSFDVPVLVMRDTTERPEATEAGTARLVGTDAASIVAATNRLLDDEAALKSMTGKGNPFGDGRAAIRIADDLEAS